MSAFVPPTWITGFLFYAAWIVIPLILAGICAFLLFTNDGNNKEIIGFAGVIVFVLLAICGGLFLADWSWHYTYEVPSVQEKVVVVDNWQPTFGRYWGEISGAGDLMMQTKEGELFGNTENFLFGKFNTRDILNQLKPNGTYKIQYYGWREGYNNGVPNILSVTEVINENGTSSNDISHYMNKRSIIYDADDGHW